MPRPERAAAPRSALRLSGLLALAVACAAAPAALEAQQDGAAAEDDRTLEEVERALAADQERAGELRRQAEALAAEIPALQAEMVTRAAAAQDEEERLTAIEATLAIVENSAAEKDFALRNQQARLGRTLAALLRLARQPSEALILGLQPPVERVRSARFLQVAVPALRTDALALQAELAELQSLRDEVARRRAEAAKSMSRLAEAGRTIAELIARKQGLQRSTAAERAAVAERVAALAKQAKDLRKLLKEAARAPKAQQAAMPAPPDAAPGEAAPADPAAMLRLQPPENIRTFPRQRTSLTPPVRGRVMSRFGEPSEVGLNMKGITIAARPQAQVVAPYDGQVVFLGPFRGYGEILIIEHRGGYHSLLAGLGRTDAAIGQWLLAGEPVGVMAATADGTPELYLELRRGGEPINPLPWLKARDSE